jgi:hypothetical protein
MNLIAVSLEESLKFALYKSLIALLHVEQVAPHAPHSIHCVFRFYEP